MQDELHSPYCDRTNDRSLSTGSRPRTLRLPNARSGVSISSTPPLRFPDHTPFLLRRQEPRTVEISASKVPCFAPIKRVHCATLVRVLKLRHPLGLTREYMTRSYRPYYAISPLGLTALPPVICRPRATLLQSSLLSFPVAAVQLQSCICTADCILARMIMQRPPGLSCRFYFEEWMFG
jgi:hypothetical protein